MFQKNYPMPDFSFSEDMNLNDIKFDYNLFEHLEPLKPNRIFKASLKEYNKPLVLKTLILSQEFIPKEIIKRQSLDSNENILQFFGLAKSDLHTYVLVYEYADSGTFRHFLERYFRKLNWNAKLRLAKQLVSAVTHLHENDIVHGRLHSENILVHEGMIKIGDFISSKVTFETNPLSKLLGYIQYFDPMYLRDIKTYVLNKRSDIYSVGVLLWEISSGTVPYESEVPIGFNLLNAIIYGKRETTVKGTPQKYVDIYKECWKHDIEERPTIQHVARELAKIVIIEKSKKKIQEVIHPTLNNINKNSVFLHDLLQLFIDESNTTDDSVQIVKLLNNFIDTNNKDQTEIINQLIYYQEDYYFNCMVGFFYEYGIGVPIDYNVAFDMYSMSSRENIDYINLDNLDNLTLVEKDEKKGFELILEAVEEGNSMAKYNLGYCYEHGKGTDKGIKNGSNGIKNPLEVVVYKDNID
ncbi:3510_t:CDS:2 [Cetraspora pellucida]|uniref:3510_t:CDS:1 n=1 Tax=Cetraspora pellucida TaxID=1433469 RepID=A0ACA9LC81_9GLOM|nr:3510_t:CDS:2 [Cetraspora pellucida]